PGSYNKNEEPGTQDVLHEDHPLIESALRWVRASRFRKDDDYRLACVAVPELSEPDLIAIFLLTLQDGMAVKHERLSAVRVTPNLDVSSSPDLDEITSRVANVSNVPVGALRRLFEHWWHEGRTRAEAEALRRAKGWLEELRAFRGMERQISKPDID